MADQKIYLVSGEVNVKEYMEDDYHGTSTKEIRLVYAETEEEAQTKFINHFESFTSEYSVYYYVSPYSVSVTEPIM